MAIIRIFLVIILASYSLPVEAAKRAIVIGFSAYSWKPLPGVIMDAHRIFDLLRDDYQVTVIDDRARTRKDFRDIWKTFVKSIDDQDEVLIYYAGHAIDVKGANYLLPLDAEQPTGTQIASSLTQDFITLRDLITEIQNRTPVMSFWVIDACRENPYATRVRGDTKEVGLSRELLTPPTSYFGKTVLFFSADFGQSALDTIPTENRSQLSQIPDSDKAKSPFAVAFSALYPTGKNEPLMLFMQHVANLTAHLAQPADQTPQPQGFPPDGYCLIKCQSTLVQVSFSSATGRRTTFDPRETTDDSVSAAPKIQELQQIGNAVFVGKLSQENCIGDEPSNDYPLGCEFLKRASSIARADGNYDPSDISSAVAKVDVNVRRSSPRIEGDELYYDCKVGVLRAGEPVKLKGVAAYQSPRNDDTFLFAVVDSKPSDQCGF